MSTDDDPTHALSSRFRAMRRQEDLEARQWQEDIAQRLFARSAEPLKLGRFTVLERLGSGGSGVVFAAWDPRLERRVAVKVLHDDRGDGALEREARTLARLNHPNVVAVYEVCEADDTVFLAMEFVDGTTVDRWLPAAPRSVPAIVDVFAQAARGLHAAHQIEVVHGDVKPSNILVGADGRVRIGDFGIARHATDLEARGVTPAYMSPEQAAGAPPTPRSDQFSLCVGLFEALHGVRPFAGSTVTELGDNLVAGRRAPVGDRPEIPPWLTAVLERGLAIDPAARHPDLGSLAEALSRGNRSPRSRWIAVAAGSLAVMLSAFGYSLTASRNTPPDPCEDARGRLAAAWSDDTRTRLEQGFAAHPADYAQDVWDRVASRIDAHVQGIESIMQGSCAGQTEADLRRRLCIERRISDLEAVLAVLTPVDATVVEHAVQSLATLTPPRACDPPSQQRVPPLSQLEQQRELYGRIARARAARGIGQLERAVQRLEAVRTDARDLGHPRITALALLELGRHHAQTVGVVDGGAAEPSLEAAYFAAEVAEDDQLAATAMLELAHANVRSARFDDAQRWIDRTRARFANQLDKNLHGRAALLEAMVAGLGEPGGEVGDFEAAAAALRDSGIRDMWLASALNSLGELEFDRGDYRSARQRYQEARDIWRDTVGPLHPSTAGAHGNLGEIELLAGNLDDARAHFETAASIRTRAWGADSPWTIHTLAHLGDVERRAGRTKRARELYQAVLDAIPDPSSFEGAANYFDIDLGANQLAPWAHHGLALLALRAGHLEEARHHVDLVSDDVKLRPERHPDLVSRLDIRALVDLEAGSLTDGLAWLDRVEGRVARVYGPTSFKSAFAPLARARLHAAQGDAPAACAAWRRAVAIAEADAGTPATLHEQLRQLASRCGAP